MQHDWIMDVLEDVRSFAQRNEMPALAEHMGEALRLAAAELERRRAGQCGQGAGAPGTGADTGTH